MLSTADLSIFRCPRCKSALTYSGGARHGYAVTGALTCAKCRFIGPVREGVPSLYEETAVSGTDRIMRFAYNLGPFQHDFGVRYALPLAQDNVTEADMRADYMTYLFLERLRPRSDGQPLRVLEVGMGTGSNIPLLLKRIPPKIPVELWGCDLSAGMMKRAQKRLSRWKLYGTDRRPLRMLMADAHALPFADASFDRVFHVGGIGAFRSPMKAMREMARVARPSSEIVVVDENLDPARKHGFLHRLAFWSLTALDPNPHPPREGIPFGSVMIADKQVSRFYYCLAFRTPPSPSPRA